MLEDLLLGIASIATEELIATVPREQDSHPVLLGESRAEVGRNGRGVSKRLVVRASYQWNGFGHVPWSDIVLMRLCAEMAGGDPRVLHLVIALCGKPDRERVCGVATNARQQPAYRRAVRAPRQERTDMIGLSLTGDRLSEERAKASLELLERRGLVAPVAHMPVELALDGIAIERRALPGSSFSTPSKIVSGLGTISR
jgi:hypothetical protein